MDDRACTRPRRWTAFGPIALAATLGLAGCVTTATAPAPAAAPAPLAAPLRTGGDLTALRRCMDHLLLDHGTRDLTIAVEPGAEAGQRDLMIAAISDLTPRSRAVRIVEARAAVAPQYLLRGAVRSLDAGPPASLGLDLTLFDAQDMSVVPGTASRNTATLRDADGGTPAHAELRKFGTRFAVPVGQDAPRAVASRALLDLGAIELIGRLAKVPYWTCFGASASEPAVATEIQDWYDTMASRPAELIGYFQQSLRTRRVYDGPVDGAVNPALKDAVARAREALGLSREPKLSLDLFRAWLAADAGQLEARLASPAPAPAPAPAAAPAPAPAPRTSVASPAGTATPQTAAPLALRLGTANDVPRFAKGESVKLTLRPTRDAFVYCFHQDENRRITRFFPNRFRKDSRVAAGAALQLPGAMRFEIVMNAQGVPESVACFGTELDVLARLPAALGGSDFAPLPVTSFEQIRSAFAQAARGELVHESLLIRSR